MKYDINFIEKEDFKNHVKETIEYYGSKLETINLKKFNSQLIDPIKLIFDKNIYNLNWEQVIKNEINRQRDKSNNNEIGYFHQNIFKYIKNCEVPKNGKNGSWDIIYKKDNVKISNIKVDTIYVEMKNKHNTMNSSSSQKTYIRALNQIKKDKNIACFLVEAIALKSQNIAWEITVDGEKMKDERIRKISIDKFYELVTGEDDAFFKICVILPSIIQEILETEKLNIPNDTVYEEILKTIKNNSIDFELALYLLGFSTYNGFNRFKINSTLFTTN